MSTLFLSTLSACAEGRTRQLDAHTPSADAGSFADGEEGVATTTVALSDSLPQEERNDLEIVVPSAEPGDNPTTLQTPEDEPATFVAARKTNGSARYIGIVPPGYEGRFELGIDSTSLAVSYLPLSFAGFRPDTQRALLWRLPNHPTYRKLRDAIKRNARRHPRRPPFGPGARKVHELARQMVEEVADHPSKYSPEAAARRRKRRQGLKIGSFCAADRRLSCRPKRCAEGKSGITELDKDLKYCVGNGTSEVVIQNPKTVYYGIKSTAPDGTVRDVSLLQAKGGLLQGFANGPPVSNLRAKPCDRVTICQDFLELPELGSENACALGASANAIKALSLGLAIVMTGADILPESSNIRTFGRFLRNYAKLLESRKAAAVISAFAFTSQALDQFDTKTGDIYIDLPGGGTAGPVDIDDVQAILRFVVDISKILSVTPTIQDAKRWNDARDWEKALDDLIVSKPGDTNTGGVFAGMTGLVRGLAIRARDSANSKLRRIFSSKYVNAKTVTVVVGAVGTLGLLVELRDGDLDLDRYARLVSMALQDLPRILEDLGVGLADQLAQTFAVSLLSMSLGTRPADAAWQVADKAAPFVYDLTLGGFRKQTFKVPPSRGGTCQTTCSQRCSETGRNCGSVPGCPSGACGTCSSGKTCTDRGSCVAPIRSCAAAQNRLEARLRRRPDVGVADLLSGIQQVADRVKNEGKAAREFRAFSQCLLSECRGSSFPRSCYRDAVAAGGPCHGVCSSSASSSSSSTCADGDPAVPDAAPQCDGRDNDCDGAVDEIDPATAKTETITHTAAADPEWPARDKTVASTPAGDGICAAFLDTSGAIEFAYVRPDGTVTSHIQTIPDQPPKELLEMSWSGTNCGVIYRRAADFSPDDNLYLARWNPSKRTAFAQMQLTDDANNSVGDWSIAGLEFVDRAGWVAAYVEGFSLSSDPLYAGTVAERFDRNSSLRRTKVSKLDVDPYGPRPSVAVGEAPSRAAAFAIGVASRWGDQYQVRVYTGATGTTAHRSALDIPYDEGEISRLQLESVEGTSYLAVHNASGRYRLREIESAGGALAYGRTGSVSTGTRTPSAPTNLLGGGGRAGLWLADPRTRTLWRVEPHAGSFRFSRADHPDLLDSDIPQTVYRDPNTQAVYVFALSNRDPYASKLLGYSCF